MHRSDAVSCLSGIWQSGNLALFWHCFMVFYESIYSHFIQLHFNMQNDNRPAHLCLGLVCFFRLFASKTQVKTFSFCVPGPH